MPLRADVRAMNYDPQQHQRQLEKLLASIDQLTPEQQAALGPLVDETKRRQAEIDDAHHEAHDALDDWRLTMKYLVFTNEAKRREVN